MYKYNKYYPIIFFFFLIYPILFLKLWRFDLTIPLQIDNDAITVYTSFKMIIEEGWFFTNQRLSYPFQYNSLPFNTNYIFEPILVYLFSFFTHDYILIGNLIYLLTYYLVEFAIFYVFVQLKFTTIVSFLSAIIYTSLSYHYQRGIIHISLSYYWTIPLLILLLFKYLNSKKWIQIIFILSIISITTVYNLFFSAIVLFLSLIYFREKYNDMKKIKELVLYFFILVGFVLIWNIPFLYNKIYYTKAEMPSIISRLYIESEMYGLKMIQILSPITNHQIGILGKIKEKFVQSVLANENETTSLGILLSLCFIYLMYMLIFQSKFNLRVKKLHFDLIQYSSRMSLAIFLIGTVGGIGSIFNFLITKNFRAYNRIIVFIAFFCLIAFAVLAQKFVQRNRKNKLILSGFIILILAITYLDSARNKFVPVKSWVPNSYKSDVSMHNIIKERIESERAFFQKIENSVPKSSAIYQYPYMDFPESPHIHEMRDYSHFRAFLNTHSLKWSYGAIKGSQASDWNHWLNDQPLEKQIDTLKKSNFVGIYLERAGDKHNELEKQLRIFFVQDPLEDDRGRFLFFNFVYLDKNRMNKFY